MSLDELLVLSAEQLQAFGVVSCLATLATAFGRQTQLRRLLEPDTSSEQVLTTVEERYRRLRKLYMQVLRATRTLSAEQATDWMNREFPID